MTSMIQPNDSRRVLYAEDEPTNRKLLQIQLERAGISCDLAADGEEAVTLFRKHRYPVVILDQYMPGLNGDAVAKILREENPGQVLIAITSDDSEVSNLQNAGFNEIFIKPLRGNEYLEAIIRYLP